MLTETTHKIRELQKVFTETSRSFEMAKEGILLGSAATAVSVVGSIGAIAYRFTDSSYQNLQTVVQGYQYPKTAKEVNYLDTTHPMHQIVNSAINHQIPKPQTQKSSFLDGVSILSPVEGKITTIDVKKLNTEIQVNAQDTLNHYYDITHIGIGAGAAIALASIWLINNGRNEINRLHKAHFPQSNPQREKETRTSPPLGYAPTP